MYPREKNGVTNENIVGIKSQRSNDGDETPEMFNFLYPFSVSQFLSQVCVSDANKLFSKELK